MNWRETSGTDFTESELLQRWNGKQERFKLSCMICQNMMASNQKCFDERNFLVVLLPFFDCWHGIPQSNSGFIPKERLVLINTYYGHAFLHCHKIKPNIIYLTLCLLPYFKEPKYIRNVEIINDALNSNPILYDVWENGALLSEEFVVERLNDYVNSFCPPIPTHHKSNDMGPFVTTLGPTVLHCVSCNEDFGDCLRKPTLAYSQIIKKRRGDHFHQYYNATESGYPTKESYLFPLHRIIRTVLSTDFPLATNINSEILEAIAHKIKKSAGFIYRENLGDQVTALVESYFRCLEREKRHEMTHSGTVSFYNRYLLEIKFNKSAS